MATKLSHPYKDHSEPWQWPKERDEEIEEIYQWYASSCRCPTVTAMLIIDLPPFSGWLNNRASLKWLATTSISSITRAFTTKTTLKGLSIDTWRWEISSHSSAEFYFHLINFSSCERRHQNASESEIRSCPRFNLFITQRMCLVINSPIVVVFLFFFSWKEKLFSSLFDSNMVALPDLTKEGYRILSYRLKDYNPSNIVFGDGVKVRNT